MRGFFARREKCLELWGKVFRTSQDAVTRNWRGDKLYAANSQWPTFTRWRLVLSGLADGGALRFRRKCGECREKKTSPYRAFRKGIPA